MSGGTDGGASPGGAPAVRSGAGPGAVVTIGTFDGVHEGHRELVRRVCGRASELGLPGLLVTFDRHPLSVIRPESAPELLTTLEEKVEVLAATPLDRVAFLPFTPALSRRSPESFVREFLVDRFGARVIVIGEDHGFGRSRSGDVETLHRLGGELGFRVEVVADVEVAGEPVSSTRIRRLLRGGRLDEANRALGRPYSLRAPVVRGLGRGRDLGFPTANLSPPAGKLLPREGIYAVRASLGAAVRRGLVHLGPRPTFEDAPPSLELHVLEFGGELYGRSVKVEFLRRLRDVESFESAEALVEQMARDREAALRFFREGDPETALQGPAEPV